MKLVMNTGQEVYQMDSKTGRMIFSTVDPNRQRSGSLVAYDLDTKEISLISSTISTYSRGFYAFDNKVVFNENGQIVLHDFSTTKTYTIYNSSKIYPYFERTTETEEAIYFSGSLTSTEDLWKLDKFSSAINNLNLKSSGVSIQYILASTDNNIYFLGFNNEGEGIWSYNTLKSELIEVFLAPSRYYELDTYLTISDDLIFMFYDGNPIVKKYNSATSETLDIISNIDKPSSNFPDYRLIAGDVNNLAFLDVGKRTLWVYDNINNTTNKVDLPMSGSLPIFLPGHFIALNNKFYFDGSRASDGFSLYEYDINTRRVTWKMNIPSISYSSNFPESDPGFLNLSDSMLIAISFENSLNLLTLFDLKENRYEILDTLDYLSNIILFENDIYYLEDIDNSGKTKEALYKFDFEKYKSELVKGKYLEDDGYYISSFKRTLNIGDSILFLSHVNNNLWNIDDSYYDSTLQIEACDSYNFLGEELEHSEYIRKKIFGTPDTVISLTLDINNIQSGIERWNYSANGGYLLAIEPEADTYQWFSCEDRSILVNETSRAYDFNGDDQKQYGVIITKGGCIDTTGCPVISSTNSIKAGSSIYPNPSSLPYVSFKSNSTFKELSVNIFDLSGNLVDHSNYLNRGVTQIFIPRKPGIYILYIQIGTYKWQTKLIKQ